MLSAVCGDVHCLVFIKHIVWSDGQNAQLDGKLNVNSP